MDFSKIKENFIKKEFNSKISIKGIRDLTDDEKKEIVSHAFNDADPYKKTQLNKFNTKENQSSIANAIIGFIESNYSSYDEFKAAYCALYKNSIYPIFKNDNVTFGKIQKIINMTIKYLYCFSSGDNEKNFYYCYMPLDSYIYEDWYLNDVKASLELKFHKKDMPNCWSNIDEEKFFSIQEDINRYIDKFSVISSEKLTPLQTEFLLWPFLKCRRAKKELIKQYEKYYSDIPEKLKKDLEVKY